MKKLSELSQIRWKTVVSFAILCVFGSIGWINHIRDVRTDPGPKGQVKVNHFWIALTWAKKHYFHFLINLCREKNTLTTVPNQSLPYLLTFYGRFFSKKNAFSMQFCWQFSFVNAILIKMSDILTFPSFPNWLIYHVAGHFYNLTQSFNVSKVKIFDTVIFTQI